MERDTEELEDTLLKKERRVAHHGLQAINFSFKEASVDPFGTGGIIEDELKHASAFRYSACTVLYSITLFSGIARAYDRLKVQIPTNWSRL